MCSSLGTFNIQSGRVCVPKSLAALNIIRFGQPVTVSVYSFRWRPRAERDVPKRRAIPLLVKYVQTYSEADSVYCLEPAYCVAANNPGPMGWLHLDGIIENKLEVEHGTYMCTLVVDRWL